MSLILTLAGLASAAIGYGYLSDHFAGREAHSAGAAVRVAEPALRGPGEPLGLGEGLSSGASGVTDGGLSGSTLFADPRPIALGLLLALIASFLLIGVMSNQRRRCVRQLVLAAEAVARGDYSVAVPRARGPDLETLALAVRRLREEVCARERALVDVNRELERRVAVRTRALRASQRLLNRQRALQRLVIENIGDGVVAVDRGGRLLLWNACAEGLVGPGPAALAPAEWATHFGAFRDEGGEPFPAADSPLLKALDGQASDDVQLFLRNPSVPSGRWLNVTSRPLLDEQGAVIGGVMTLRDVTELREVQSQRVAHGAEVGKMGRLALLGELAALVSHQLSQPVAAIANYAGAAMRLHGAGRLDEKRTREILSHITRLADRAGANLQGIRSVPARRDSTPREVDLNVLLDSCLQLVSDQLKYGAIQLSFERDEQLPKVQADPRVMEQVLLHLIVNAIEAVREQPLGRRRVRVATGRGAESTGALVVVEDSGKGLGDATDQDVFEPWVTTKVDSLGVGLSIVRSMVEAHGGCVWMDRTDGGGTVFKLKLPGA